MSDLKLFKCHKEVHARPMTRGVYNDYKGWQIPDDEDPTDEGVFVVYNKDTDLHYESWSPKEQFDEGYSEVEV